jgi:dipeptidyl aminopeptidase/acylaminoacyl peptidase
MSFGVPSPAGPTDTSEERLPALIDAGSCWNAALSPGGHTVAFLADEGDRPQVFLSPVGLWAPRQVTFGPQEVVDLAWSGDGGLLAYVVAQGGGDRTQLHVVDADGRSPRPMFVAHPESAFAGAWTRSDRGYAFSTTLGPGGSCTAYLLDLSESTLLPLARAEPGDGRILVTDISPDRSRTLLRTGARGRRGSVLVDRTIARRVPLVEPALGPAVGPRSGNVEMARFSADGRTVYVRTDVGRDFPALGSVDLDIVGDPGPLQIVAARDDAELELFTLNRDRTIGVLVWNVGGWSVLEVWEPATGSRTEIDLGMSSDIGDARSMRGVVGAVSLDASGRRAVFDLSGPGQPRSLWLLDVDDLRVRKLGLPPGSAPPPASLVEPTLEPFPGRDGLDLSGWLYRPPGVEGPAPTVLSFHGGPEAQERPAYSPLFQSLLSAGIAVFAPNVRGSSGYGKVFEERDTGEGRFAAIQDVLAAAEHVVRTGVADAGRLGIHGSSYGGYLVLAGITESPETFAAAVDICGIANFETFFSTTEPWRAETSKRKYGDPDTQRELLRALSPIHRMDRVRTPTLVVHGTNDANVPLRESEQVVDALEAADVPVEQLLLPDAGECLRGRSIRREVTSATVRWFVTHLGAGSDPPASRP